MTYQLCRMNFAILIGAAVALVSASALGQDEKPAARPKAATKLPAKGTADAAPAAPFRPVDPAVETILEGKPTTPREVMQAILSLNQLDRPDLAKQYIDKLLAAKLPAAALADLAQQNGSALFIELSTDKRLLPQSRTLAQAVLQAAADERRNPEHLAALVKQLSDPSPDKRLDAVTALREAGVQAVPALLTAAGEKNKQAAELARAAIVAMGAEAAPPLAAALQSPQPEMKTTRARAIGRHWLARLDYLPARPLSLDEEHARRSPCRGRRASEYCRRDGDARRRPGNACPRGRRLHAT